MCARSCALRERELENSKKHVFKQSFNTSMRNLNLRATETGRERKKQALRFLGGLGADNFLASMHNNITMKKNFVGLHPPSLKLINCSLTQSWRSHFFSDLTDFEAKIPSCTLIALRRWSALWAISASACIIRSTGISLPYIKIYFSRHGITTLFKIQS